MIFGLTKRYIKFLLLTAIFHGFIGNIHASEISFLTGSFAEGLSTIVPLIELKKISEVAAIFENLVENAQQHIRNSQYDPTPPVSQLRGSNLMSDDLYRSTYNLCYFKLFMSYAPMEIIKRGHIKGLEITEQRFQLNLFSKENKDLRIIEKTIKVLENKDSSIKYWICEEGSNIRAIAQAFSSRKENKKPDFIVCEFDFKNITDVLESKDKNFCKFVHEKMVLDSDRNTLFHHLCATENLELIKLFNDAPLAAYIRNSKGQVPFHIACASNNLELVKLTFLEKNLLEYKDFDGNTPLHTACLNGNREIVEFLLKEGADPNMKNHSGYTALDVARSTNNSECIELLSQCAAKEGKYLRDEKLKKQFFIFGGCAVIATALAYKFGPYFYNRYIKK